MLLFVLVARGLYCDITLFNIPLPTIEVGGGCGIIAKGVACTSWGRRKEYGVTSVAGGGGALVYAKRFGWF